MFSGVLARPLVSSIYYVRSVFRKTDTSYLCIHLTENFADRKFMILKKILKKTKQQPTTEAVARRRFSKQVFLKFSQYHRKLESLFNKVAGLMASRFIKKSLKHRCFPVNIAKFLKTAFLLNTSGGCYNSSKCLIDSMTFVSLFLLQIYQIYFLE